MEGSFDIAGIIAVIGQLGFAAAAWRLATALRDRVENHEIRLAVIENVIGNATVVAEES